MNLFAGLKAKIYAGVAMLFIGLLAVLKWYRSTNQEKAEKIVELKKQIEVGKRLNDENMKVKEFNARQELKKEEMDKEIKKHNNEVKDEKNTNSTNRTLTI